MWRNYKHVYRFYNRKEKNFKLKTLNRDRELKTSPAWISGQLAEFVYSFAHYNHEQNHLHEHFHIYVNDVTDISLSGVTFPTFGTKHT